MLLLDRIILLTGGAGALGKAITSVLTAKGATVYPTDVNSKGVDAALDVTSESDWRRVVDQVGQRFGRLDGLVNNAGIIHLGNIEDTSLVDLQRVMDVNVNGVFLGCKMCWPLLRKSSHPSVVNVSSVSGIVGSPDLVSYNASKGAVRLMTKSIGLHGARVSPAIRCNSIHPCLIEGSMAEDIVGSGADAESVRARLQANIPLGRFARPEEIAESVAYLLSDMSLMLTGSELVADGGYTAR